MARIRRKIQENGEKLRSGEIAQSIWLAAVFVLGTVLLFLLFTGIVQRNTLLNQLELEKEFAELMAFSRMAPIFSDDFDLTDLAKEDSLAITGIEIFSDSGTALISKGDVPHQLILSQVFPDTHPPDNDVISMEAGGDRIIYIRSIKPPMRLRNIPPPPGSGESTGAFPATEPDEPERASGFSGNPALLYISARLTERWIQATDIWLIYAGIELGFAALLMITARSLRKSRNYREQLESQERLVTLGNAARTLTHEIRNPLSAIALRLSILEKTSGEVSGEDINVIKDEVKRLKELSNRVRVFLQNPRGVEMVIDAEEFIDSLISRLPQNVKFHPPESEGAPTLRIWMDPEHLRSVLENLIVNAHQASDGQQIDVVLSREKTQCRIEVKDRGTGIPDKIRTKVYDPFFTTKTQGTGIGLSIAQNFIRAAGGTLEYGYSQSRGSIFTISLPLISQSEEEQI